MNRLILTLILIFSLQFQVNSDDVKSFEIAEMSIGNSLLDYFSEEEINNARDESADDKIFIQKTFFAKNTNLYEFLQISFKNSDKKKIIHGIAGAKQFKNNFDDCLDEMNIIDAELSKLFPNSVRKNWGKYPMASGGGFYYPITYDFKDKSSAMVSCQNFDSDTNIDDNLKVAVYSSEFGIYLQKQN